MPREFAAAMAPLSDLAAGQQLAVAVSGGRDSMTLALLAHQWARERGKSVTALIVDHGLRPSSADEARSAAALLTAQSIASEILVWQGAKPARRIEEQARRARYDLLTAWCLRQGVAVLLTAHHQGDQAETVAMRLMRGSSIEGLAGISAAIERDGVVVARPLLGFARARLSATVAAAGLGWIDDPSNDDLNFERNRWRARLTPPLSGALVSLAERFGGERQAIERHIGRWLAAHASVDGFGVGRLDGAAFTRLPEAVALRVLSRLITIIAGRDYQPRRQALRQALSDLAGRPGVTAGGCRLLRRGRAILAVREFNAIAARQPVEAGQTIRWDGRFEVNVPGGGWLGAIGAAAWPAIKSAHQELKALPAAAGWALPALWSDGVKEAGQMLALPAFLLPGPYGRQGVQPARFLPMAARFRPRQYLASPNFALV